MGGRSKSWDIAGRRRGIIPHAAANFGDERVCTEPPLCVNICKVLFALGEGRRRRGASGLFAWTEVGYGQAGGLVCVCVVCVGSVGVGGRREYAGEALGQDAAEAEDAKVWPSPPEDVSIKLALVDPKASYQQGERIEVKLSFSTTRPGAYTVDLATYDRSGRLPSETFLLEPAADVVDPLAVYFESGGGMMGGGLRQIPVMEKETLEVTRTLNEHVRFLKPGRYTLRVVTDRVGNDHGPGLGPLLCR